MSKFILSAFADEIDSSFDTQLSSLNKLGIDHIELRGVDGKSFSALTDDEVEAVKKKLENAGVSISALGSPIGKMDINADFEAHKALFVRIMDIGDKLGCKRVRIFSFYPEDGMSREKFEKKVFAYMGELLDMADSRGFTLCHENEKGIYGESPDDVLRLVSHFEGRLRVVLDPGNFAFCGLDPKPGYNLLKDYIEYLHIKDADEQGAIVPPGEGTANIKETLSAVASERNSKTIITMEPHLMVFTGLSSLSKLDDIKHKHEFSSPFQAFEYATNIIKKMVESL